MRAEGARIDGERGPRRLSPTLRTFLCIDIRTSFSFCRASGICGTILRRMTPSTLRSAEALNAPPADARDQRLAAAAAGHHARIELV